MTTWAAHSSEDVRRLAGCIRTGRLLPLLVAPLLAASGCGESEVEGLHGAWGGQIQCAGEVSEISLSIVLEGSKIRGSSQIRTKGSNMNYSIMGGQTNAERLVECLDALCDTDPDCKGKYDFKGATGSSRCDEGLCTPCYEKRSQEKVTISLVDENVGLPDPLLELWRYADSRLEGTIQNFCSDQLQDHQVVLVRD